MIKKTTLLFASILLLSGCTREVYLQAVPCEEDCGCPETTCPELDMVTETVQYQVLDVPSEPIDYNPCAATATKRNCRRVCREVRVN